MMRTLQLKDLASYLPYGLKWYKKRMDNEAEPIYEMDGVVIDDATPPTGFDVRFFESDNLEENPICMWASNLVGSILPEGTTSWIKPILRPMSDLTKPCLEGGKIPIVEIGKMLGFVNLKIYEDGSAGWNTHVCDDYQGYSFGWCQAKKSFGVWYDDNIFKSPDEPDMDADILSVDVFDFLHQHHFDYRGLIEAGLAIDTNTIKQ